MIKALIILTAATIFPSLVIADPPTPYLIQFEMENQDGDILSGYYVGLSYYLSIDPKDTNYHKTSSFSDYVLSASFRYDSMSFYSNIIKYTVTYKEKIKTDYEVIGITQSVEIEQICYFKVLSWEQLGSGLILSELDLSDKKWMEGKDFFKKYFYDWDSCEYYMLFIEPLSASASSTIKDLKELFRLKAAGYKYSGTEFNKNQADIDKEINIKIESLKKYRILIGQYCST